MEISTRAVERNSAMREREREREKMMIVGVTTNNSTFPSCPKRNKKSCEVACEKRQKQQSDTFECFDWRCRGNEDGR
jgi:hypothetical protein